MSDIDMDPDRLPAPFPVGEDGHPMLNAEHPRKSKGESRASDFDYSMFAAEMVRIRAENEDKARLGPDTNPVVAAMHVWKVLGVAGIISLCGAISAPFAAWYTLKAQLQDMTQHIADNSTSIKSIVDDREKYRTKYLPMVEAADKINDSQQSSIEALRDSVRQLRDTVAVQQKSVSETHEDVAVLKNLFAMKFGLPGGISGSGR